VIQRRLRVLALDGAVELLGAGQAGLEAVSEPPVDVALIAVDAGFAAHDIEAIDRLRERASAPVVAVVDGPLAPRRARALAAAAAGIVESAALDSALAPTLHAAAAGQAVVPAALLQALERPPLTNREKQILAMVVLGCSNPEIATKLVITERTVKNHLSSVFAKLGVRSRAEASSLILDPSTGLGLGVLQLSGAADD
jgi:DNA-binding NarL/FixJ family response regulator